MPVSYTHLDVYKRQVQTTRRIAKALSLVEITLADHIVVAEDDFVSLAQSGLFHPGVDFED